jgi:folylpolyglutamate synthase/dihydropteroate synthase
MNDFLSPILELIKIFPPVEIITTEPQNGRYPGVEDPLNGAKHIKKPSVAIESFKEETELIVVTGSLYLCGNILSHLGINVDILS